MILQRLDNWTWCRYFHASRRLHHSPRDGRMVQTLRTGIDELVESCVALQRLKRGAFSDATNPSTWFSTVTSGYCCRCNVSQQSLQVFSSAVHYFNQCTSHFLFPNPQMVPISRAAPCASDPTEESTRAIYEPTQPAAILFGGPRTRVPE